MKKPEFNIKESFGTKNVKFGAYSSALTAIVIAIMVVVNVVFSQLPSGIKTFDMSPNNLYSIGSQTETMLDSLESDVQISVLSAKDSSDSTINSLLDNYKAGSKHISIGYIDPTLDMSTATKYSGLASNSLVISSGTKETTVDYNAIYVTDYSSYYTTGSTSTTFDGEGQITSAIAYVTSENSPKLYSITGHGESTMSSTVTALVSKQNIETAELNLMTSNGIPEDCDELLIYAPTSDYTAEEAQTVINYLNNGGHAMILASYTENDLTNFKSILSAYGVNLSDRVAMEGSSNYYQYPMYVIPNIESTDLTETLVSENANILIPSTLAMTTTAVDGVTTEPLLSSSSGAYAKQVTGGSLTTYEKESGDTDGPFGYAYLSTKAADSATADTSDEDTSEDSTAAVGGALIVVSAASLIDDSVTQSFTLGNLDFFMNCLSYLSGDDSSAASVSIDAKSMDAVPITVSSSQITIWMVIAVVIIPVGIFIAGLIIWLRRRKK